MKEEQEEGPTNTTKETTSKHSPTCKRKDKEVDHCCKYWCKICKGDTRGHAKVD